MHAFLQSVVLFVYANDEGFKQVKGALCKNIHVFIFVFWPYVVQIVT